MSTEILETQKSLFFDLQDHLKISCNFLPVFGFSIAKLDNNLLKRFLLPLLVNERWIEPNVIK